MNLPLVAALAGLIMLALSGCADLPPGKVPYQPNAQQGGGDAYFNRYRNVGY